MKLRRAKFVCLSGLLLFSSVNAQQTKTPTMTPQSNETHAGPVADPKDVASLDAILTALYDVISGPAGQPRDWQRMRALFAPGARLIPTAHQPDGTTTAHAYDVDGYIERASKAFATQGFYERGIVNRVEQFGRIAHVFSTYEARHDAKDPKPFLRGINSIQLLHDGQRWWVVTIFWDAERPGNAIPEKYLSGRA